MHAMYFKKDDNNYYNLNLCANKSYRWCAQINCLLGKLPQGGRSPAH